MLEPIRTMDAAAAPMPATTHPRERSVRNGSGARVVVARSPWRLGPGSPHLLAEWLAGWVAPAVEQRPGLGVAAESWLRRRHAELGRGRLTATVEHVDVLALPAGSAGKPGEPGAAGAREAGGAVPLARRRPAARPAPPEVSAHG